SWGCGMEVADMLKKEVKPPAEVAVLGAGVIGLSTAHCLLEAGYHVSVYAKDYIPETTSHKAGGQWCPTLVNVESTTAAKTRYDRILTRSHAAFQKRVGGEWGVFERPNYVLGTGHNHFDDIPRGVLKPKERLDRLPFHNVRAAGLVYHTL